MDIQKLIKAKYTLPILLTIIGFVYYFSMYARELTWIYTTSDSTDWLTQLRWWIVPQAYGKPLFISLIHLVSYIPFGTDVDKITIFLVIIPAAITVGLVYLSTYKLTSSQVKSTAASLVLLGAVVCTSQAAVVEQYAMVSMFITLALYFYIGGKKKSCAIALGLLTATHIIGLVITVMLVITLHVMKKKREWASTIPLYILFGIAPYSLILIMMASDAPKLIAGDLSVITIFEYLLGNPAQGSQLALILLPKRLMEAIGLATLSLGFAIVPIFKSMKAIRTELVLFLSLIIVFCSWFYITSMFHSVWKYVAILVPSMCILAGVGLTRMTQKHTVLIISCAILLIITNAIFFNTNTITKQEKPMAQDFIEFLQNMEDGDGIIIPGGGAYGFATFYTMSKGKDIVPIIVANLDKAEQIEQYQDYLQWMDRTYGLTGNNYLDLAQAMMDKGHNVYFVTPKPLWMFTEGLELSPYNEIPNNENDVVSLVLSVTKHE